MNLNNPEGSIWSKWDMHIHSPASSSFTGGSDYSVFIENLAKSEVDVIGINDYNTIAGYLNIKEMGGVPDKVVFPVVEFRMENILARKHSNPADGGARLNFHLVFDNDPGVLQRVITFLTSLNCKDVRGVTTQLGAVSTEQLDYVTFNINDVLTPLNEVGLKEHSLLWIPYNEYGGIDNVNPTDNYFKTFLIKEANIIGSGSEKVINFFKWKDPRYKLEEYETFMERPKPCIKGSDAHEIDYPFGRLKNEKSEPIERFCWIKGDHSFNGLRQIVFEPDRVYIGKEPELTSRKKSFPHKFLKELQIDKEDTAKTSEEWFDKLKLPLNSGLVAIIGKKGNAKSAIADVIGLASNAYSNSLYLSFLHRDKFRNAQQNKAKDFKGRVQWVDHNFSSYVNLNNDYDPAAEERIKYIPQNYLEKLCVSEEQTEFTDELGKIIFAHIPDDQRLKQLSLDDLLGLRKRGLESEIGQKMLELSVVNRDIVRLEVKDKEPYLVKLNQDIRNKEADLEHHDNNKPVEKHPPEEDEVQKVANAALVSAMEAHQQAINVLDVQKRQLEKELSENNISLNDLNAAVQEINTLTNNVNRVISSQKNVLEKNEIDVTEIITYSSDTGPISRRVTLIRQRNLQIGELIHGNTTTPGIITEITILNAQITDLQNQLATTQREYREYLLALKTWTDRRDAIVGAIDKPGSLEQLKGEKKYVEERLPAELLARYSDRQKIALEIYELKQKTLSIYTELYGPVTEVLVKESSFVEEYNIRVNASLITKGFEDSLFSFINQKNRGSFAGSIEGKELLSNLMATQQLDSPEGILSFLDQIILSLKTDLRENARGEIRYPDEQLRKDLRLEDLYDYIFGLKYIEPQFKLQLGNKDLKQLSPGERGAILLIFYLFLDIDNKPLMIDQPEENLDNESIYHYLVHFIKKAKNKRQIILLTHNPNLAVVCDAEQIIQMSIDKQNNYKVSFVSGGIENPEIAKRVINILEGTKPAFDNRRLKYSATL